MKILLTENQFMTLNDIIESELREVGIDPEGNLRLDVDKDLTDVKSIEDLTHFAKGTGLKHGEKSKSRALGADISKTLSTINTLEDRELFETYFLKIKELISIYKKSHFSLKRLSQIVTELLKKDINVAKEQMETIISIFEDPKFEDKHKKKLITMLVSGENKLDLDKFFEETRLAYMEYEQSFSVGGHSPFDKFATSPEINVYLKDDVRYNNWVLYKEFNKTPTDIGKVLKIINFICDCKTYGKPTEVIKSIVSSIKFMVAFDYNPDNIKADLVLNSSLVTDIGKFLPMTVADKGEFVEVKFKPYKNPSYLSEFFKVDSTDKNYETLLIAFGRMRNLEDPKTGLTILLEGIAENLYKTLTNGDGDKIINHLTSNLAGIIFKDNLFIKKEDIRFGWNTIGYAKRPRLSIWYYVKDNPKIWKISKLPDGCYSRFVTNI
jgi:hypothetical protein